MEDIRKLDEFDEAVMNRNFDLAYNLWQEDSDLFNKRYIIPDHLLSTDNLDSLSFIFSLTQPSIYDVWSVIDKMNRDTNMYMIMDMIYFLFNSGMEVSMLSWEQIMEYFIETGYTLLFDHSVYIAKTFILENGDDIHNYFDSLYDYIIRSDISSYTKVDMISVLISEGFRPDKYDIAVSDDEYVFNYVISYFDQNILHDDNILHRFINQVIENDNLYAMKYVVDNIDFEGVYSVNRIIVSAIKRGSYKIVRFLIERYNVDIHREKLIEKVPLDIGYPGILKILKYLSNYYDDLSFLNTQNATANIRDYILRFNKDPKLTKAKNFIEENKNVEWYSLFLLLSDEYLILDKHNDDNDSSVANMKRFIRIVSRLPQDVQMKIANALIDSAKEGILMRDVSKGIKHIIHKYAM